jgi:hypothetical protein
MKLIPYRSHLKQYRIWHSPVGSRYLKQVELVEAYNGREAQQIVKDEFPGHIVGHPILVRK